MNSLALAQPKVVPEKKIRPPLFKWKEISIKQALVMCWWKTDKYKNYDMIVADGSIRAGKTVSMSFGFVDWAMHSFSDELFGLCGKTIGSLRQNVVEPLKKILKARKDRNGKKIFSVRERRGDKLLIIKAYGRTNTFELFGGNDEKSQDAIQGRTLAGVLFDEVALMPESFVNQALGRCSVEGSKMWFNCNPDSPFHWFKVNFIDKAEEKNLLYLRFTMDDNLSLTEKIKDRYRKMFKGVFYSRFILGLWVIAEGIIYDMFSTEENVSEDLPRNGMIEEFVSVDYGTANPCVFLHCGSNNSQDFKYIYNEYCWDSKKRSRQKTDGEYAEDMEYFFQENNIARMTQIIVDPSAKSFITELAKRGFNVKGANNSVQDGIRETAKYIGSRTLKIHPRCENLLKEMTVYSWDKKASLKGNDAPIKEHDHAMDAMRYFIWTIANMYLGNITAGKRI